MSTRAHEHMSTSYRINIFEQLKRFFEIVFSGKYDIKPVHISMYFFLLNQSNRSNWVEWFKCPIDIILLGTGINSNKTYYNVLDDLKQWKLIDYIHGENRFSQAKFHICRLVKTTTLHIPLPEPLPEPLCTSLNTILNTTLPATLKHSLYIQLTEKLLNLITDNLEQIKEGDFDFYFKNNKQIQNKSTDAGGELKHLWNLYLDMRKKKNKPLVTEQGREKTYEKLRVMAKGNPDIACKILEQSIANEWIILRNLEKT